MGANAGGANVGGVLQIEQGTFTINNSPTTFSVVGGETNVTEITVPAGHKWILKAMISSVGTFVGTVSANTLRIYNAVSTKDVGIQSQSSITNVYFFPQPLTLAAGDKLRYSITTSAWTSGQGTCNYIIQDVLI